MVGKIFVTVGTTEFDSLIQAIDNISFLRKVKEAGYTSLCIQFGRGSHQPDFLVKNGGSMGLAVEIYRFKPNLDFDMATADVIISHCGAGSILEGVRNKKKMVLVVNSSLQDNHQTELADALCSINNSFIIAEPDTVAVLLPNYSPSSSNHNESSLKEIPIANPQNFTSVIDSSFVFLEA
jgi:UDP-N-acetylglucosamine transferase subunit ALG13